MLTKALKTYPKCKKIAQSGHTGCKSECLKVQGTRTLISIISQCLKHDKSLLDKKAKDLFDVSEELDIFWGVVVVAQLVERSLLTPEVRSSNPVIGKLLLDIYLITVN